MDIFVGSLPFKIKEEDLKSLFEQYGKVASVTIIIDNITRQNKGFGFVKMPNDRDALKAIKELNGAEVMGRKIKASKSESKEKDNRKAIELLRSGKVITKKKKVNVIGRYKDSKQKDEKTQKRDRRIKTLRHKRKRK
ncbi:RNA-binding protein [Cytophagaceae bacterium ABcell3]|nr:RNA-binding protein [Cytophagaceae bacterium ABcell3]